MGRNNINLKKKHVANFEQNKKQKVGVGEMLKILMKEQYRSKIGVRRNTFTYPRTFIYEKLLNGMSDF